MFFFCPSASGERQARPSLHRAEAHHCRRGRHQGGSTPGPGPPEGDHPALSRLLRLSGRQDGQAVRGVRMAPLSQLQDARPRVRLHQALQGFWQGRIFLGLSIRVAILFFQMILSLRRALGSGQ